MRTAAYIAALALIVVPLHAEAIQRARYLMGTVCEVAAEKPEQIERAFDEAKRIESMLSTWTDDSELAKVNRGDAKPGPELRALLDDVLAWSDKTNRAFDPRIGHLIGRTKIAGAIEEGAFGKGYALDRMLALIDGDALINFGGQLIVRGAREVSVADPRERNKPVLAFTIANASLSTSSGAHILDPRTGKSIGARGSVSVIAKNATDADILSTALYVMGEDDGLRWADAHRVAAVFITPANHIRLSAAAREQLRDAEVLDRHFTLKD